MNINKKIEKYFEEYMNVWPFSGVVSVVKDGEVLSSKGYGMANIEHNIPNDINTKYKIASITKQFTCAGIMILQQRGLIDVSDSISKFFPDYPGFNEKITIHHLMTHTSGLFNDLFKLDGYVKLEKCLLTHKEVLDIFCGMPAEFEPGEQWSYCYFGYYLLGLIIERVSGMSYIDFLKENIFNPLGMVNTGLDDYFEILSNKVSGYYATEERLVCGEIDTMSAFSAGSIYSTMEDMLIWDKALYDDKILFKESKNLMFTPGLERYGYGWFVDSYLNRNRVHHSGGGNGFNHQVHRYIDDKVTIMVFSNYGFSNSLKISEDIAKLVFNEEYYVLPKPKVYNLDMKIYESYMGLYEDSWCKFEVKKDGEKFYFIEDDKWIMNMYPISKNKFHHTWIDREYSFEKDSEGQLYFEEVKRRK